MEPETGVQADFIGKRKRAMWRADKRIPRDPRVAMWHFEMARKRIANELSLDCYRSALRESPLMGLLKRQKR